MVIVDQVRPPIESPALPEILAEIDSDRTTARGHSLLHFRSELPAGSGERHVIESGSFGCGYHVAVIATRKMVAVAGQRNVAVELVLVVDALEVELDLSGVKNLLQITAYLVAVRWKARIERSIVISIEARQRIVETIP